MKDCWKGPCTLRYWEFIIVIINVSLVIVCLFSFKAVNWQLILIQCISNYYLCF
jgi:hypothetical protein